MKFAFPNFRLAGAWIPERLTHFIRHYFKEIGVALVLAVVAALIIDPVWAKHERQLKSSELFETTSKPSQLLKSWTIGTSPLGKVADCLFRPVPF